MPPGPQPAVSSEVGVRPRRASSRWRFRLVSAAHCPPLRPASGAVPTMQERADCVLHDFRIHRMTVSHRGGHGSSAASTGPTDLEIADLDVPAKRCCLEWHGCVGYQPHRFPFRQNGEVLAESAAI